MPSIYNIFGYKISIWSNENNEAIHVHVSKGRPTQNATKLWMYKDGTFHLEHNKSRIPETELNKIIEILERNAEEIRDFWKAYMGYEKYIK